MKPLIAFFVVCFGVALSLGIVSFVSTFVNDNNTETFRQQLKTYRAQVDAQLATKLDNINGVNVEMSKKRALVSGIDFVSSDGLSIVTGVNDIDVKVDGATFQQAVANMCPQGYATSVMENGTLICALLPINVPNGIVGLNQNIEIPQSIFPTSVLQFINYWKSDVNLPFLQDGDCNSTYSVGNFFVVITEGNTALGNGQNYSVGDWVLCTKMGWQQNSHSAFEMDFTETQKRVLGTCSGTDGIREILQDGNVVCESTVTGQSPAYQQLIPATFSLTSAPKLVNVTVTGYELTLPPGQYFLSYELGLGLNHALVQLGEQYIPYCKLWIIDEGGNILDGSVDFSSGKEVRVFSAFGKSVNRRLYVDIDEEKTYRLQVQLSAQANGWIATFQLTGSLLEPDVQSTFWALRFPKQLQTYTGQFKNNAAQYPTGIYSLIIDGQPKEVYMSQDPVSTTEQGTDTAGGWLLWASFGCDNTDDSFTRPAMIGNQIDTTMFNSVSFPQIYIDTIDTRFDACAPSGTALYNIPGALTAYDAGTPNGAFGINSYTIDGALNGVISEVYVEWGHVFTTETHIISDNNGNSFTYVTPAESKVNILSPNGLGSQPLMELREFNFGVMYVRAIWVR